MKVTAFIRKTAAKNNVTDLARVYFRVRDGKTDIKAASELSISPNHWSAEKQGYKSRVAFVSDEKQMAFDKAVQDITHLITKEYHRGVDGKWLQDLIEGYHHPNISGKAGDEYSLVYQIQRYIDDNNLASETQRQHQGNINKLIRYERFQHEIMHRRGYAVRLDTITPDDLRDFHNWLRDEHTYVEQYPLFYKDEDKHFVAQPRGDNSITGCMCHLRTVIKWCVKQGITTNNPFDHYKIVTPMYADPFYLTLEERNKVYDADLSGLPPSASVYRDIFMFQCMIGCRASDLNMLTKANLVDGVIEYIPVKTKGKRPQTVRVPLNQRALAIVERYKDLDEALIPRFGLFYYNKMIKRILKYCGIDRMVITLNSITRQEESKPLWEAASSHTARKTFIGNLYKQVKDPNLIASMSGHSDGSRAFARYRKIDDDMKKELVQLLD